MCRFHVIDLSPPVMEKSLGVMTFKHIPRPGEWIEIETDGAVRIYKIVQIVHELVPDEIDHLGEDTLYIAEPRESGEARFGLYETYRGSN